MANAQRQYANPAMPWEKQEWEQDKQYNAFRCYMLLPRTGRSILRAYRIAENKPHVKKTPGHWLNWCAQYDWVYRAEQHDQIDREARISREAEKIADIRNDGLEIIHEQILKLGADLKENDHKPYDRAYAIQTIARTMDLVAIKKRPGEERPDPLPAYKDPWLVGAEESGASTPDA